MLTANDFKRLARVEAQTRKATPFIELVDALSDIFAKRDQTTSELISTVVDLAQYEMSRLVIAQKDATRSEIEDHAMGLTTPEALLSSRQLEAAIRPAVEQLRYDYFGATKVPFPSYKKAVAWLRRQAVVLETPNKKQMARLFDDVREAMRRFPKDWDVSCTFGSHGLPLLASKPGALKEWVSFDRGTALEKLNKLAEAMSAGTGCDVALCAAHVLVGTPLLLRPLHWGIELSAGCGLDRCSATVDILQPHAVTLPALSQVLRSIRKKLGISRKKTMTSRHERLIRIIQERGGAPSRDKTAFWERVQRAWNKTELKGEHPYKTWQGPMMAYRRIQSQLKKRNREAW
ncbi:MAG: hypothetical protein ABIU05_24625 [Nitrospirales bacterium]